MTLLHDAVDAKKLDVRLIEKGIARGNLNAAEIEKSLKLLPDDSENADYVSIEDLANDGKFE